MGGEYGMTSQTTRLNLTDTAHSTRQYLVLRP